MANAAAMAEATDDQEAAAACCSQRLRRTHRIQDFRSRNSRPVAPACSRAHSTTPDREIFWRLAGRGSIEIACSEATSVCVFRSSACRIQPFVVFNGFMRGRLRSRCEKQPSIFVLVRSSLLTGHIAEETGTPVRSTRADTSATGQCAAPTPTTRDPPLTCVPAHS